MKTIMAILWVSVTMLALLQCTPKTTASSQNAEEEKTDIEKSGIKGHVKEWTILEYDFAGSKSLLRRVVYRYDSAGNISEWARYEGNGLMVSKYEYSYDAAGRIVEEKVYRSPDFLDYRMVYRYNEQGHVIEEIQFDRENKIGAFNRYRYRYDSQNRITEMEQLDENTNFTYRIRTVYDISGRKIEEAWDVNRISELDRNAPLKRGQSNVIHTYKIVSYYDNDGNRIDEYYNDLGDLTERKGFDHANRLAKVAAREGHNIYHYNEMGKLEVMETIDTNQTVLEKSTYEYFYDEQSNNTKIVIKDFYGNEKAHWVYLYDDKNNLISESLYDFEGIQIFLKEYQYRYND